MGCTVAAIERVLESLFDVLVAQGLLVPVRLKGSYGRPLLNVSGVYQMSADRLRLTPNRGASRCRVCRRTATRNLPHRRCPAWRCSGVLEWVPEDEDNYNLQEVSDRIRASRSLDEHISDLEKVGLWVFGCRDKRVLEGGTGSEIDWPVAHIRIRVLRNTNPAITVLSLGREVS